MAAIFRFDNDLGSFELAVDEDGRLIQGESLVSEMMLALYTDAPADVGDPVPPGTTYLGNVAADFDGLTVRGSKLWILRYIRPASKAVEYAKIWTEDALEFLVTRGDLLSVVATASLIGRTIKIRVSATLPDGTARTFSIAGIAYTN